jgi:hypothetical protein
VLLTQTGDFGPNYCYLVIELDYLSRAPEDGVPCFRSTRLMILPPEEGQISLPDPFKVKGAKIVECILKGCSITHRCADYALDRFKSERSCTRWNYVVADMIALGFQNEGCMKESLSSVITRHNLFEAFLGVDSPLRRQAFPQLSRSLPAELGVAPWIWIKDPRFIAWFTEATGKSIATRVAELRAQASQDECLEVLLRWATDPKSPTLECAHTTPALLMLTTAYYRDLGMKCSSNA